MLPRTESIRAALSPGALRVLVRRGFLPLREEKLGEIEVALLGNFEVLDRPGHHSDLHPGPLYDGRFVGAEKSVCLQPRRRRDAAGRGENPAGVCADTTYSRGIVEVMIAPWAVRSTCLIVSMAGTATIAAPCFSDRFDGSRNHRRRNQRTTASCTRTISSSLANDCCQCVADALRRVSPPSIM